jgi:outer membrane protein OmpA-like peptidoglycan-associated protein
MNVRPSLLALLLVAALTGATVMPVSAEEMTAEDIAAKLTKKKLTRSLKKDTTGTELDAVLSRSIGVVERKKIVEITQQADLPRLDFTINFGFDSAEIDRASFGILDTLATALQGDALYNARFLINGHTDSKGSDDYNLDLSQRRADAVVQYLVSYHQLNATRLKAIGFGESALKDSYDGEAAVNRRVEIVTRP